MYRQDPRSMQRRARRRLVPFGEERRCRVLLLRELLTGAVLEVNGQSLRRGRHFLIINVHDADQTTSGTEMWINYQTGATDASSPLLTHGIRCHEADPRSTPQPSTRCSLAFGCQEECGFPCDESRLQELFRESNGAVPWQSGRDPTFFPLPLGSSC